ncbi:UDP-forming cellulose synthase catalytic subunit [Leptolyngbya sp. FACHB-261]|uniref:UDP-forming cellulose synthase catalytic subunit n=1 Tax=Leptolyngbya sp. FACHB-261 TaxID=2692806 RepID=UPI0018EFB167|nr:UDP-forming cellulose synthase catalytic subunit [Leptolyngbya sp. FACHB-261]
MKARGKSNLPKLNIGLKSIASQRPSDPGLHRMSSQQIALLVVMAVLNVPLIVAPLTVWQQAVAGIGLAAVGYWASRISTLREFLVGLSTTCTLRYLYYRATNTLNLDNPLNTAASLMLFGAELYAVLVLLLGYFQTIRLTARRPPALPLEVEDWPKVDVYIPTYNEAVEIVRKTALGALSVDYPNKAVYILDDGRKFPERRKQLLAMAEEIGCGVLTRDNNDHAKAGNINAALRRTDGDLVLILDCDHIPTRNILLNTVGFFQDPLVSLVQTPHWFYNPDPFERNLLSAGRVPSVQELFYKVVQRGNDFWNAAFFCGSAAVVRRAHLLLIGGIAIETVTEDCHTSFRLHAIGYKTIYYDQIMVAGLAPETFASYVSQQMRWARGMAQILRLENPLFKTGLTIPQRLCYFSAMLHFFYGIPRLAFAIAPVLFLLFRIEPIRGISFETVVYALPHILLGSYANYALYKHVRYSFWSEVYEFAMSFYTAAVTTAALINPRAGAFNVTAKGISVTERNFDWGSARPLLAVTGLVFISLLVFPVWLFLAPEYWEAVTINAVWCAYNLILLVCALLASLEQPQLRNSHRLRRQISARIFSGGRHWSGETVDISESGAKVVVSGWPVLPKRIEVELQGDSISQARIPAVVLRSTPGADDTCTFALQFLDLTQSQQDNLGLVIYSDTQLWYSQNREQADDPVNSFWFITNSLLRSLRQPKAAKGAPLRRSVQAKAMLYWEGQLHTAEVTSLGLDGLDLALEPQIVKQLHQHWKTNPLIGLELQNQRLVAQIRGADLANGRPNRVQLVFPSQLERQQRSKVQNLLDNLPVLV